MTPALGRFVMALLYEASVNAWNTTHTDNWALWDLLSWLQKKWDLP